MTLCEHLQRSFLFVQEFAAQFMSSVGWLEWTNAYLCFHGAVESNCMEKYGGIKLKTELSGCVMV